MVDGWSTSMDNVPATGLTVGSEPGVNLSVTHVIHQCNDFRVRKAAAMIVAWKIAVISW